ncbi:ATP-dependent RNA helicase dbp7, partial [Podila verticillata]
MDGGSLVLNFSAPTGDAPVTRLSKPKGGRWKDRVKVVKSVKRKLQVAGRPTPSHQSQPKEADHTPTPVQGRSNDNYDDFMEAGVSKEAKVMHGKSQVQSSIFSPDTEIIPKVKTISRPVGKPSNAPLNTSTFTGIGLDEDLVKHMEGKLRVSQPTIIQQKAIPVLLGPTRKVGDDIPKTDTDVIIQAETGSGKTLTYLLPIVNRLIESETSPALDLESKRAIGTLAIIMTPTRELAKQILQVLETLLSMPASSVTGKKHSHWIVPGIVIGGDKKKSEKARLRKGVNILVGTPGRLLDHLQNTQSFNVQSLRWLVLDEADRLLELGFEESMTAILKILDARVKIAASVTSGNDTTKIWPQKRQTVLCSATLSDEVQRLAGTSLVDPIYISAKKDIANTKGAIPSTEVTTKDEKQQFSTPQQLKQLYVIAQAKLRLVTLAAMLKSAFAPKGPNTKAPKVVVFLSSCDSVDFHHGLFANAGKETKKEASQDGYFGQTFNDEDEDEKKDEIPDFVSASNRIDARAITDEMYKAKRETERANARKARAQLSLKGAILPDVPLFRLHGNLAQNLRTDTYFEFCKAPSGILFATDVAARGLDLPDVSHIIQYDPPSDLKDYVHRVGRTARLGRDGEAVLFLLPSEVKYLELLTAQGLPNQEVSVTSILMKLAPPKSTEYQQPATDIQNSFERYNLHTPENMAIARGAFWAFVKSYATHPSAEKHIFHIKNLHLGHIAKSFALREAPSDIPQPKKKKGKTGLRPGGREEEDETRANRKSQKEREKEERAKPKITLKRKNDMSEFAVGDYKSLVGPMLKRKKSKNTDNIPEEHVQVDCEQESEQEHHHDHDYDHDHRHDQEQHQQKQQHHHIVHFDNTEPSSYPPHPRGGLLGQLHSPFMSKSSDSHQHPSDVSDQDDYSELGGSSKHKNKSKRQSKQESVTNAQQQQSSSDQHQHQHHQEAQQHSTQPERTERSRHSNGYSTIHSDNKKSSHPTRRLSSSINTNGSPPSSSSTSIPSSPSQYSLPFNHNNNHHQRAFEKEHASSSSQNNGNSVPSRSRTRSKYHPDLPNIPLNACRSASFGCSYPMITLFLLSFAVLGCVFHSNFYHQVDADNCEPIYMQPKYYKLLGFDRERTAFAGKYGLFLFRDQYDYRLQVDPSLLTDRGNYVWTVDKEAKIQPLGIPALFIPGNAGSAKQVRAIAKAASKYYYETLPDDQRNGKPLSRPIDFFTVDFNEEFSALHGHSLLEQAQFLNDAIAYILTLYRDGRQADPELPQPTSVMIIGHSMGGIVARSLFTMDNFKPGSVNTILTAATPHMVPPVTLDFEISNIYDRIESFWTKGFYGPDAPLQNVSLISIAGGNRDIIVNGDSGNIHNFVPQSHGFTVFTATIPHAWVGSDHLSILWCNQIAVAVGKALIDVVDATIPEQVKPLEQRMTIFRNRFLTGLETHLHPDISSDEEIYTLSSTAHTFIEKTDRLALPSKNNGANGRDDAPHLYIMELPWESDKNIFSLLTDHTLGPESRLDIMLCNDMSTTVRAASSTPNKLACQYDTLSAVPIPASVPQRAVPIRFGDHNPVKEFQFVSKSVEDLDAAQFIVIYDRGQKLGDLGFLVAEFTSEKESTITAETTSLGSLAPQRFSPMLRQSSWTMYEDKYSVNIVSQESGVNINFHGEVPYYDRIQLPGKKGIELKFWMDPTCPVPLTINFQVDKYGSLGKVMIRYRMVVLVFTFLVVVLTLRAQFKTFNQGGPFKPFGLMLTELIGSTFWKFSVLLAVIAFVQSLPARTVYSFMDPAALLSIGIVILIWMLLNGLVRGIAGLLAFVSKRGGRFVIGKAIGNILSKR